MHITCQLLCLKFKLLYLCVHYAKTVTHKSIRKLGVGVSDYTQE